MTALAARSLRLGFPLLFLFVLLFYAASPAGAAEKFCSQAPFNGVIDGNVIGASPVQITIDTDCVFQNWPQSNPLTATINFQTNDPSVYLIIFDRVWYAGNMACANIPHKLWVVNSPEGAFSSKCQNLIIPAETIDKKSPGQNAAIGVPFTYTLTLPSMQNPLGDPSGPSINDLGHIRVIDDLNGTGAALTLVGAPTVAWKDGGDVAHTFSNVGNRLSFDLPDIPAGKQLVINITVVLDDTPANTAGLSFTNTVNWMFARWIDLDGDGPLPRELFDPLPGEAGVSSPMTIAEPDLVVTKTSTDAALNLGVPATYTIDVWNTGASDAWNATISDRLPDGPDAGMCDYDPTTAPGVSARVFAADGVTPVSAPLVPGVDFSANYSGAPACLLSLTMRDTPAARIGPFQHLVINYQSRIDGNSNNGIPLTNVAGATTWFSGDGSLAVRRRYDRGPLTNGTPGILDFQDSETVTTALAGYYLQKTVANLTSGANPAATAAPGDRLRYRLRLFSIDQAINGITLGDALDPGSFDLATLLMVTPPPAGAKYSFDPVGGLLSITGDAAPLNVAAGGELVIEFEITLKSALANGAAVDNQATLSAAGLTAESDDPNINGIAPPGYPADPTRVVIRASGPLSKANTQASATVGGKFKYRITVPAASSNMALYDVRILDDLGASAADMRFISVAKISGSGDWMPVNSGSDTSLVIEDTAGGIDIPAGEQAAVEVTVELLNTPTNVIGLSFTNTADYTYNQVADTPQSRTNGLPGTTEPMRIVGLTARKTVSISVDSNSNGLVDPGDVLLYTIAVSNPGSVQATGVVLIDDVPADTVYVVGSTTLNGLPAGQPDGGVLPLASGMAINSPGSASGVIAAGSSAAVAFRVAVNDDVPAGTMISNVGYVNSDNQPSRPTGSDGNPGSGDQPTVVVVGTAQQVVITKEVFVIGGGAALPGGTLEYVVRVTNTGAIPATSLVITDNMTELSGMATYVAGSATLDGTTAGVSYFDPVLVADYAHTYGNLLPGATTTLRFCVLIASGLSAGTRLTNTAKMAWGTPTLTAFASVSIDIGGVTGSAMLGGRVWRDANLNKVCDDGETDLAGWTIGIYRGNVQVASATTGADGFYSVSGLEPTLTALGRYELRFTAPGAGPNTASMGHGDSPFTNGPQRISGIIASSGANLQNLNLPISPNGAVYNSVQRIPVAGAKLTMLNVAAGNAPLPGGCFDDPAQQNQITAADGFYKFDLNFNDPACPAGGIYLIEVTPPGSGYAAAPSRIIPPNGAPATPFSVPPCPGSVDDAIPATAGYCEVTTSASVPPSSVPPRTNGTTYHVYLTLSNGVVPGQSQVFNNHIPVDPVLDGAVAITKTSPLINVTKAQLVPYTITVKNVLDAPLYDLIILDRFPAGFKYVEGSARLDGNPLEPRVSGLELLWEGIELQFNESRTLRLLLVVGAGVSEGEYVNRAQVLNSATGGSVSGEATATVRVIPDPTFDCTDVIGKVFDDRNLNGRQDAGEPGLGGVRLATARGLIATTDEYGRFHIACAAVPDELRGSNFILKLDDRTLPTGFRVTTENPLVLRATRGKMLRFNFGATIHHAVSMDVADGAFEPDSTELRMQWQPRMDLLLKELRKAPSVLRLSYLADVENENIVKKRLKALKEEISGKWDGGYRLTIETEVFWRRGSPPR